MEDSSADHELVESAARGESSIVGLAELIDPIEFGASHGEDVEIIEEISHVVHKVEDGKSALKKA